MDYHANSGKVKNQTDPNGVITAFTYDDYNTPTGTFTYSSTVNNLIEQPTASALRQCGNNYCDDQQNLVNTLMGNFNTEFSTVSNTGFFFTDSSLTIPELKFITETRKPGSPMITSWLDQNGQAVLSRTIHSGEDSYVFSLTNPLGQNELVTQPFEVLNNNFTGVSGRNIPHYTFTQYDERGRLFETLIDMGNLTTNGGSDCKRNTQYVTEGGFTEITAMAADSGCENTNNPSLTMYRSYDSAGKLRQTVDANKHVTQYWYDSAGAPYIIADAMGNPIITEYDNLGRKLTVQDPNMGKKTFKYNSFGEVVYQQDDVQKPQLLANYMVYDELGRITDQYANVDTNLQPKTSYRAYHDKTVYTHALLTSQTRDSNSSQMGSVNEDHFNQVHYKSFEYDEFARIITEEVTINDPNLGITDITDVSSRTDHYYYQDHNFLKQTIYSYPSPDDEQLHTGYSVVNYYDIFGSLIEQRDNPRSSTIMSVDDFNLRGQIEHKTLYSLTGENSMVSSYTYYPGTGQAKSISHGDANRTDSQVFNYEYDGWGNITSHNQNIDGGGINASETFAYDELQRLITSTVGGLTPISYSYDNGGLGNLEVKSDFSIDQRYGENNHGHAGPNAITTASLVDANGVLTNETISYNYDAKGNRINESSSSRFNTFVYDSYNLLIQSEKIVSAESINFRYGTDNQRYFKEETSFDQNNEAVIETTLYLGPQFELIQNATTGELQSKFQLSDYLMVTRDANQVFKYHFMQKDRLGSTTQILDKQGIRIALKGYDAFGKPREGDTWGRMSAPALNFEDEDSLSTAEIDVTKRGFTDHEHLDNFELIHMNGRMYDFNNGRFLSVDPFIQGTTSQAINPYSYIQNNPLSGIDPSGYVIVNPVTVAIAKNIGRLVLGKAAKAGLKSSRMTPSRESTLSTDNTMSIIEAKKTIANEGKLPPNIFVKPPPTDPLSIFTPPPTEPATTPETAPLPEQKHDTAGDNGMRDVQDTSIMTSDQGDVSDTESESSGKKLDTLIGSSENHKTNKSKNTISEKPQGNFDGAVEEFDELGLDDVKPLTGDGVEGKTGSTDDGRTVTVRSRSKDGRPTIQVQKNKATKPEQKRTTNEVRYGKKPNE
ncbi:RHS repeat domain-containing protein [Marinicella litoralis]|nr:RHS repeat-associated core domain-containing protein [Marinicella litoralis]